MERVAVAAPKKTTPTTSSQPLTVHDWKVLGAYGAFVLALSLYDAKIALYIVGIGAAVVLVRNGDNLGRLLP